jgi:hypothetical protein
MEFNWMTAKEAAELWGVKDRRVQAMCVNGQIKDVVRLKGGWLIPKGTPKPPDGRHNNKGRTPRIKPVVTDGDKQP